LRHGVSSNGSCLEPLAEGGDGEKRVDKARNGGEPRETETEPYKWDPPVRTNEK
jgi:hypothetical protein